MLIENFSAMVQGADQAPDLIRAIIDFSNGHAAAFQQSGAADHHGNFLVWQSWAQCVPPWY